MKKHLNAIKRITLLLIAALLVMPLAACDTAIPTEEITLSTGATETTDEVTETDTAAITEDTKPTDTSETTTDTPTPTVPDKLRFGSYNIKHGADADLDMSKLAKNILTTELDIVGFQEVDQRTTRVNNIDTMQRLSNHTGYKYYAFFKAMDYKGGEYGVGVLSKYPIVETERIPLYSGNKEPRVLGRAEINVNGLTVNFFVTHLSYESLEIRTQQFKQIAEKVKGYENFIITGDFNTSDFNEFSVIENSATVNNSDFSIPTFPGGTSAIDNIVYEDGTWSFSRPWTFIASYSDHYLLYAEAELLK